MSSNPFEDKFASPNMAMTTNAPMIWPATVGPFNHLSSRHNADTTRRSSGLAATETANMRVPAERTSSTSSRHCREANRWDLHRFPLCYLLCTACLSSGFLPHVAAADSTNVISITGSTSSVITVASPYLLLSLNTKGTLGQGSVIPGLKYAYDGDFVYSTYDIIQPGTPLEGFVLSGTTGGTSFTHENLNSVSSVAVTMQSWTAPVSGSTTATTTWNGRAAYYNVTHVYRFQQDVPRVWMTTTITSTTTSAITGLEFLRVIDPDQGTSTTINKRGYSVDGVSISLGGDSFVAASSYTGAYGVPAVGLFTYDTALSHNTSVSCGWSTVPSDYASGSEDTTGDCLIGLMFHIGTLSPGASVSMEYAYGLAPDYERLQYVLQGKSYKQITHTSTLTSFSTSTSLSRTYSHTTTVTHTTTASRTTSQSLSRSDSVAVGTSCNMNVAVAVGASVGAAGFLLLLIAIVLLCRRRKIRRLALMPADGVVPRPTAQQEPISA